MPSKKHEEPKIGAEPCILKIGRYNNVVQWREEMQDEACGLYGMTSMIFSTNASYVHRFPREEEYNPSIPPAGEGAEEVEEDEDESVEPDEERKRHPPDLSTHRHLSRN